MNAKQLMRGLIYLQSVTGKRQKYYVFKGAALFVVLSFSPTKQNAGNFNIVDPQAVDFVRKRLSGKRGVTTGDVVAVARRSGHASDALIALNILYVLTALGAASIDARRRSPKLFFNVRRT